MNFGFPFLRTAVLHPPNTGRTDPAAFKRVFSTLSIMLALGLHSQEQVYNHPELEWRTIETTHFFVHFHEGAERTASLIGKAAEDAYGPITGMYGYVPDGKVHIIVRDHDDESNGAAYYYDNKIEIWASAMDFALRGNHPWIRNVVSHEFAHLVSLGASRKGPRQVPAVYLQWIGYEPEKRTDVIHGYPNAVVSLPLAGTVVPMWFAEGMSQTQNPSAPYDAWDSHRDMLLRTAALDGKLLSLAEMGIFGKDGLGNERVYNQGYGLVLYLTDRFGGSVLADLARAAKSPRRLGFSGAVERVLGKDENGLYREWTEWLSAGYADGSRTVRTHKVEGEPVEGAGSGNFYPRRSPDGKRLAYLSNRGKDFLSQTSLWVLDSETSARTRIAAGVEGAFGWSPDGGRLAYARKMRNGKGSHFFDLFVHDLKKKKETRLSRSARLREPDWSPDGRFLVCVTERDGTDNLVVLGADGKNAKAITSFQNGEQVFAPRWFKKGGRIAFGFSEDGEGRDIAAIDSSGSGFRCLIRTERDERDPCPSPDGRGLLYASDCTGIFNIHYYDETTDTSVQLTNAVGGAFMPSQDPDGTLVFCRFGADGYAIAQIRAPAPVPKAAAAYESPYAAIRRRLEGSPQSRVAADDRNPAVPPSKTYRPIFSNLSFMPRLMVDFPGKVKVGTYLGGSDFLGRISLFGGFAVNGQWDLDAFGTIQYRVFYPTLFVEGYAVNRHTREEDMKVRFRLLETGAGADWPLSDRLSLRTAYQFSRYDAALSFPYGGMLVKTSYTYHIGHVLQAHWTYRAVPSAVFSSIAPRNGRVVRLLLDRAFQKFVTGFEINPEYGTLVEVYQPYRYFQAFADWTEYLPGFFNSHSAAWRLQAGWIDRPVDSFYYFFAGGMDGLKGYPYYSIEGTAMIHAGLAYRFPISRKMGIRLPAVTLDNLFLSLYGQAGNAWTGSGAAPSDWKKDAGFQVRLGLYAFYAFPMALTFDAAYGFDSFHAGGHAYGREWRMYVGLLFDYLE